MSSVGRYDQKGLKWTGQSDRLLELFAPVKTTQLAFPSYKKRTLSHTNTERSFSYIYSTP